MANPSVTYTFSNATTADAGQVNQNFTDLINGATDGTKDYSISALTCAGSVTLNGAVTLGNATGDDITVTGSLASSIPIKTTASFDIGSSSLGLRALYFGKNSQTVNITGSASMSATWTMTLPVTAGTANYVLTTNGSGVTSWASPSPTSQVTADTQSGHGGSSSGETKIRNFVNVTTVGSDITRNAQTTTTGDSFTINAAGVYAITYVDVFAGGSEQLGVSVNSAEGTTNIAGITAANRLSVNVISSADTLGFVSWTGRLAANDVIRAHTSGGGAGTLTGATKFTIVQVAKII